MGVLVPIRANDQFLFSISFKGAMITTKDRHKSCNCQKGCAGRELDEPFLCRAGRDWSLYICDLVHAAFLIPYVFYFMWYLSRYFIVMVNSVVVVRLFAMCAALWSALLGVRRAGRAASRPAGLLYVPG